MKTKQTKTDSLSDGDIEKIGNLLDNSFNSRLKPINKNIDGIVEVVVTKSDLGNAVTDLKQYINEGIESVTDGMDKLSEQLVEKKRVDKIELWTKQIADKVGVKLV